ncbi:hypothetical protein BXZ70DRAFT_1008847 [Cristinia sonorae]|uniref:DRBM domain-containing protein n=1 Tax=Cristinia sonorae TaxID=1940300 RepID=A0A8K0XPF0_9AGAR|nr:hypothetical protein BXZ70DRAFT_1008847 [Cristinia sonorae]
MANNGNQAASRVSSRYRLRLNNLLQRSYGSNALAWELAQERNGAWHAIVYISDVPYGEGRSYDRDEALEIAANVASRELYQELCERFGVTQFDGC